MKLSIVLRLGMSALAISFALAGIAYVRTKAQEPTPKTSPPPISTALDNSAEAIPTRVVNTPAVRASKQIWEYKVVSAKGADATALTSQIVGAGEEGYELVSVTAGDAANSPNGKNTEWVAMLKRPR
jgi:hypothetical protein